MNGVRAIVKKEFKIYFYSPIAYILAGIFLFLMGNIFAKFIQSYVMAQHGKAMGAGDITLDKLAMYLYQNMAVFLCFMTPFLTMRLFAEERKQQTLELLQTAPIRNWELVVGKFLASVTLMAFMVGLTLLYVFFMVAWGNPEIRIVASTYLGLFLVLGCYLAIGTFISSLTSSQAIAAMVTFVVLFFLFLLQFLGSGITAKTGVIEWGPLLSYLSPMQHFTTFTEGVLQLKDFVYFITVITFFLFATHKIVESNRWR